MVIREEETSCPADLASVLKYCKVHSVCSTSAGSVLCRLGAASAPLPPSMGLTNIAITNTIMHLANFNIGCAPSFKHASSCGQGRRPSADDGRSEHPDTTSIAPPPH